MEVTEAAAEVIETLREEAGAPEGVGLRMVAVAGDDGTQSIGLAFAPEPEEGDQVTEQSGIKVYVQDELSDRLSEAVLDARDTDKGRELVVRA